MTIMKVIRLLHLKFLYIMKLLYILAISMHAPGLMKYKKAMENFSLENDLIFSLNCDKEFNSLPLPGIENFRM